MSIKLRTPVESDAPAIAKIIFDAFAGIANAHNFPLDFPSLDHAIHLTSAFIVMPGIFGVVAEENGTVLGSNFLDERNPIAGVGPITVDPTHQGRGVGRMLMNAVIERRKSSRGVRLVQDAFNTTSMSLYASLGFEAREPLALMRGRCKSAKTSSSLRPMTENDLPACAALCERAHGFSRAGELKDAIKMFRPHVFERAGRIVAYASSPWMWFLNHGVAETESDMREMLIALSAASNDPMMMLVPIREATLFRWLLAEKMQVLKPMNLMTLGFYQEPASCWYPSVSF